MKNRQYAPKDQDGPLEVEVRYAYPTSPCAEELNQPDGCWVVYVHWAPSNKRTAWVQLKPFETEQQAYDFIEKEYPGVPKSFWDWRTGNERLKKGMTKKHFRQLAKAFHEMRPTGPASGEADIVWQNAVDAVALVCALVNKNFNRALFMKACEEGL